MGFRIVIFFQQPAHAPPVFNVLAPLSPSFGALVPMACFHADKPIEMLSAASNPMFSSPTRVLLLLSSKDPAAEAER